jgi:FMN phosphatase YigB (HAD superfamily)
MKIFMQNIRNILFDYGNVIFKIDFTRVHQSFKDLGISNVLELYGHLEQDHLFDDFDKGLITPAQFRDGIRRLSGREDLLDEQIDQAWNALLIGVPPENHPLLQRYQQQYNTYLLSNNNEIHYQWIMNYLRNEYQLEGNEGFFKHCYYSHHMGMRKPDAEIFERVLKEQELDPSETLFIDDSPQHIRTAAHLGLHTALIQPEESLTDLTKRLGLLKDE